jgi:hypothetical protein
LARGTNGTVLKAANGAAGLSYTIQASAQLPGNWSSLGSSAATVDGSLSFTDPQINLKYRVYRVSYP